MKRSWLNLVGLLIALIGVAVIVVTRQLDKQSATAPLAAPSDKVLPPDKASASGPAKSREAAIQEATPATKVLLPEPYVGTAICASCHADQYKSYLQTHHSRSLSRVDASSHEVVGAFYHEASQTTFNVLVEKAGVIHRQSLRVPTSPTTTAEFPVSELPVEFMMGSGAFAKGHLLEDQGFLVQSPVTWYSKPKQYGMAPGYDVRHHLGTTRVIDDQCMFCHAGLISRQGGNNERLDVLELAINCERCHGAGLDHVNLYQARADDELITDSKIVNPSDLDRLSAESICAQCHLQGDVVVEANGKSIWDFAPGKLLEEIRVTYKIDKAISSGIEKQGTFVDHFDQLWQSRCYQQSEMLTCITCHDPHHAQTSRPPAVVQSEHCMKCHQDESCGLEHDVRVERQQNVCFRCHMPRVASEIPHTATTNHRIAIHATTGETTERSGETLPRSSVATIRRLHSPKAPNSLMKRSEVIASALWQLDESIDAEKKANLGDDLLHELLKLVEQHQDDAAVQLAIARWYRGEAESVAKLDENADRLQDLWTLAERHSLAVLEREPDPTDARKRALDILLAKTFEAGDFAKSAQYGIELMRIRRNAKDAYNTGLALGRLQQFGEAERVFRESIRINATYTAPYRSLFKMYSAMNPNLAEQIRQTGMMLEAWESSSTDSKSRSTGE